MPEGTVAATREDLEAAVGVLDDIEPVDPAAERVPAAPAAARRHFPVVPDRAVAATREDLDAPVLVRRHLDQVDPAAERVPAAPAVIGRGLPVVPQGTVAAAHTDMHPRAVYGGDNSCGDPEPGLVRNRDHRGFVDDANGVPGKHGIARPAPVHAGRHLDVELLRQPGDRPVAAESGAVILIGVGVKSRREPAVMLLPNPR